MVETDEIERMSEELFGKPGKALRENIEKAKDARSKIGLEIVKFDPFKSKSGRVEDMTPLKTLLDSDNPLVPCLYISLTPKTIGELAQLALGNTNESLSGHIVFNGEEDPNKLYLARICVAK